MIRMFPLALPRPVRVCLCLALLCLAGGTAAAASPHPLERSLWADASAMDLSSPAVRSSLFQARVTRLIVTAFGDGQTIYADPLPPFTQMAAYVSKQDPLSALITEGHAKGVKVYAAMDCLHWKPDLSSDDTGVVASRPDLVELNFTGGCGSPPTGKYGSPFIPEVRAGLAGIAAETAKRHPGLDGLVIECRLPLDTLLGYSQGARIAFVTERQFDPADMYPTDGGPFTEWTKWRLAQAGKLVRGVASAFRAARPGAKVAVVGSAQWSSLSTLWQNASLEDWPAWMASSHLDEVILDSQEDGLPADSAGPLDSAAIAKDAGPAPRSALVSLSSGGKALDPLGVIETVETVPIDGIVVRVGTPADLRRADVFWTRTLPLVGSALLVRPGK